ncbi:MAG: biotin synthase BioB [Phycisphaerales bacterium]|nr:biotin synthase BioB [Phycisphaerales bacterium]
MDETVFIEALTKQVLANGEISRDQAESLVLVGESNLPLLLDGARRIREHYLGNRASCCSIVAAKVGSCSEDCAFCSQSSHYNTHVAESRKLDHEAVYSAADNAAANGAACFGIVNSGYGPENEEIAYWGPLIRRVRQAGRLRVCASLGVVSEEQARRLAAWGVQRYNLNLQTSRRFFGNIITTHTYDDRLASLRHLKAAGISLCSGGLFGMGETWSDRLNLAFELRSLGVDVIPINLLIPIAGTPLGDQRQLDVNDGFKIIALFRFLFPRKDVKVAGGRELCLGDRQNDIFAAGASSFLIGNYLTTCGRDPQEDLHMVRSQDLVMDTYSEVPDS